MHKGEIVFEAQERRKDKIRRCLDLHHIADLAEAQRICLEAGMDLRAMVKGIQPICFEDSVWAYTLGMAIALKENVATAQKAALYIGEALQAFTVAGSVAESRAVGTGHGELAARLLDEKTQCLAVVAGHESWAAAEGALGIAVAANKVRETELRVILNGLGKDAGYSMARMNGFSYIDTKYDFKNQQLTIVREQVFSRTERGKVRLYACSDVQEAVAVMKLEKVDLSITGNTANAVRFQHLVTGSYKRWAVETGHPYFSVASGGGTGRSMHPDNIGAGPACYGITDSLGRVHGDVQFAGSSSVPAHVEMMGMIGMGNNPIVAATVQAAVMAAQYYRNKSAALDNVL